MLNANFLTCSLCDVEDSTSFCFTATYAGEKTIKKQIEKQEDMILPVSLKVGLG